MNFYIRLRMIIDAALRAGHINHEEHFKLAEYGRKEVE